jgi:hypothetical protein
MMQDFLGVPVKVLGHLKASRRVHDSVARRRPHLLLTNDEATATFRRMAEALLVDGGEAAAGPGAVSAPRPVAREGGLTAQFQSYLRRHPRYVVNWRARLERAGAAQPVSVLDVSRSGAAIETTEPVYVGDVWRLVLTDLPGEPAVPAVIRYVRSAQQRAGVEFEGIDAAVAEQVIAAARGEGGEAQALPRAAGTGG